MAENLSADTKSDAATDAALTATNTTNTAKIQEINQLEEAMYQVDSSHTLEEQIADMKRRGINPSQSYKNWDDEDNWGTKDPNAVQNLKENDDVTPPPIV